MSRGTRERRHPGRAVPIAKIGPAEGLAKADIDGDGKIDSIGGGYWFKHRRRFGIPADVDRQEIAISTRVGGRPNGRGRLSRGCLCRRGRRSGGSSGSSDAADDWVGHDMLGEDVVHGHSLELADIDQ